MCSAGSRLIVQESCSDRLIKKIKERMSHLRLGDSLDKCVDMGAIVDPSQKKSIDEFVQDAKNEVLYHKKKWSITTKITKAFHFCWELPHTK